MTIQHLQKSSNSTYEKPAWGGKVKTICLKPCAHTDKQVVEEIK